MKILFYSILIASLSASTHAEEKCTISAQKEASNLAPRRDQFASSICYAFSAVALLYQFYCSKPNSKCDYSKGGHFSSLDATATANYGNGNFIAGGHTHQVLEAVKRKGSLVKEDCSPFDPYVRIRLKDPKDKSKDFFLSPWQALKEIHTVYRKTITENINCEANQFATFIKE